MGWFTILCFLAWLSSSADRESLQGAALTLAGVLMICHPVRKRVPPAVWFAAAIWLVASLLAFLPGNLIGRPEWRDSLAAVGIDTGGLITPQPAAAFASLSVTLASGTVALWAANQANRRSGRLCIGVACAIALYALIAWLGPALLNFRPNASDSFGFFPNRNHTATLLVMGSMVSLGVVMQGIRQRSRMGIICGAVILIFLLVILASQSVSRAGIVLLVCGFVIWFLIVGPRYLGGHAGKAAALLAGGGLLLFAIVDTPVKQRISAMTQVLMAEKTADDRPPGTGLPGKALDARLALQLDTLGLIGGAPYTGWGTGQFRYLFPQFQNHTLALAHKNCLHPESDWLWIAAERGIPAAAALLALGLSAAFASVKSIRQGRCRARRSGLLAAALVLPIHGLFDVPGHHFSLLWTSALLFALASSAGRTPGRPKAAAIGWRIAGLAVTAFGILMVRGGWTASSFSPASRADQLLEESLELYRQEHLQYSTATDVGAQCDPLVPDRLETALEKLNRATALTPLDHRLWGLQGMIALHFDDRDEIARRSFAAQRALEPAWVGVPLFQAEAWSKINPLETRELWKEAMRRASQFNRNSDGEYSRERVYDIILKTARELPALRDAALELADDDVVLLNKARAQLLQSDAKLAPSKP